MIQYSELLNQRARVQAQLPSWREGKKVIPDNSPLTDLRSLLIAVGFQPGDLPETSPDGDIVLMLNPGRPIFDRSGVGLEILSHTAPHTLKRKLNPDRRPVAQIQNLEKVRAARGPFSSGRPPTELPLGERNEFMMEAFLNKYWELRLGRIFPWSKFVFEVNTLMGRAAGEDSKSFEHLSVVSLSKSFKTAEALHGIMFAGLNNSQLAEKLSALLKRSGEGNIQKGELQAEFAEIFSTFATSEKARSRLAAAAVDWVLNPKDLQLSEQELKLLRSDFPPELTPPKILTASERSELLSSDASSRWVENEHFKFYVVKGNRFVEGAIVTTLEIQNIDSHQPGSGLYPKLLAELEEIARKLKIQALYIEAVHDPRQQAFYLRQGFLADQNSGLIRGASYAKKLE